MQGEPDGSVAVLGEFDEVVATTQGSQGKAPVPVVLVGRCAGLFGQGLEYVNAFGGSGGELCVVLAGAHGDTPLDAGADSRRRGNISALEGRPNSNHAAADVDAHGCRDHGALGRENGPDRRALSVMAVGHDGDVLEHERHRSRVEDLLLRRRLDRVPREEDNCLVVDRFHGIETYRRQAGRSRDSRRPRRCAARRRLVSNWDKFHLLVEFHSTVVLAMMDVMKHVLPLFTLVYAGIALLFAAAALLLMGFAVTDLWQAAMGGKGQATAVRTAIESVGMLAVALVALEMAQTVAEEEVVRRVHVSAPTRVRRYLSRFLVVVVVALSIESLVAVVQALHERPETLPHAATVAVGAAALLAAWGVFLRLNRSVEELEPEGIPEAKSEDHKVQ